MSRCGMVKEEKPHCEDHDYAEPQATEALIKAELKETCLKLESEGDTVKMESHCEDHDAAPQALVKMELDNTCLKLEPQSEEGKVEFVKMEAPCKDHDDDAPLIKAEPESEFKKTNYEPGSQEVCMQLVKEERSISPAGGARLEDLHNILYEGHVLKDEELAIGPEVWHPAPPATLKIEEDTKAPEPVLHLSGKRNGDPLSHVKCKKTKNITRTQVSDPGNSKVLSEFGSPLKYLVGTEDKVSDNSVQEETFRAPSPVAEVILSVDGDEDMPEMTCAKVQRCTSAPEEVLQTVRSRRLAAQRHVASSPAASRSELYARKRRPQLERELLPDAPPHKRRARLPSSERQDRETLFVEALEPPSVPANVLLAEPAALAHNIIVEGIVEKDDFVSEPEFSPPGISASVGASDPSLSTTQPSTIINVTDKLFNATIDDCMNTELDSDNDYDVDMDLEDCPLSNLTLTDAAATPACESDLTAVEAQVLRHEDAINDRAIRDMAPEDCCTFDWTNDQTTFTGRRETFTGTAGPTFPVTRDTTVVDIFNKMFDNDLIDLLCTETNRYADQTIEMLRAANKLPEHSSLKQWTPTNRSEMVSFIAVIILQGLYPQSEEEAYFTFKGYGTMPYFSRIMSYNRFLLLKSMCHFVDNQTLTANSDKLAKLKPVLDYFNDKFSTLYMPAQEIAIDESLLKWHGRLSFAQKIATKAARVGVKTYELCESSSGYLWKFFVYVGKQKTADEKTTNDRPVDDETNVDRPDEDPTDDVTAGNIVRPTNATVKIVHDLVEPLLHKGHTLIMDNFYNSPLLLRYLKKQQTDCYGTLRLNREFVPDSVKTMTKTELRQGEVVATYCSDLSVIVWRDSNLVSMISTYHHLRIGAQEKFNRVAYKPKIVLDYNKNMGGVDRKDQFLSAQPMERLPNRVWYKKVFRRLVNVAVFNCYVIFATKHPRISHRQYRVTLAEDLLKLHKNIDLTTESRLITYKTSSGGAVATSVRSNRLRRHDRPTVDDDHFPVRTGMKKGRCWLCRHPSKARFKCLQCDVSLCIDSCFRQYHKP